MALGLKEPPPKKNIINKETETPRKNKKANPKRFT